MTIAGGEPSRPSVYILRCAPSGCTLTCHQVEKTSPFHAHRTHTLPLSLLVLPCSYFIMSSAGSSKSFSTPSTPRRPNVKYLSAATLNLERVYEQNRARLQQRDGALSPTNEQASANAGKGKPRLLLMGQRRYDSEVAGLKVERRGEDADLQADTEAGSRLSRVSSFTKSRQARHCISSRRLGFRRTLWRELLKSSPTSFEHC